MLKAIRLKNFMSIGEAYLEFDDRNIIALCGYNDSGKSAVIRALEVVFYNAYPTEQIRFIKDGEEYFLVSLEFRDGVVINYYKYIDSRSVWEMYKDGKLLFTNKLDTGIASMKDVPEVIAKYLGVIQDEYTGEKLNVRKNTDRLFLINTTGGDNYKILNSVLRSDILAEASKRINEDRNKLQTELVSLTTMSNTLKEELNSIELTDQEVLDELKVNNEKLRFKKLQMESIREIINLKEKFESIVVHDEVPLIDVSRLTDIIRIMELKKQTEVKIPEEVEIIDTSRLKLLQDIITLRKQLDTDVPPECEIVDYTRYMEIKKIGELFNTIWQLNNELMAVEQELNQVNSQLTALAKQYNYKICKNCNSVVL